MNIIDLNSKWSTLESKEFSGDKGLRISEECIPDLFLIVDNSDRRGLVLYLDKKIIIKEKGFEKNRIILSYSNSKNYLVIFLKDSEFSDLFNDLILSVYSSCQNQIHQKTL